MTRESSCNIDQAARDREGTQTPSGCQGRERTLPKEQMGLSSSRDTNINTKDCHETDTLPTAAATKVSQNICNTLEMRKQGGQILKITGLDCLTIKYTISLIVTSGLKNMYISGTNTFFYDIDEHIGTEAISKYFSSINWHKLRSLLILFGKEIMNQEKLL